MVHDLCVGKSGTITTGNLNVHKFQLFDNFTPYDNDLEREGNKFNRYIDILSDLKNLIIESIVCNTDARVEVNDSTMTFEPKGDNIEVGMINFLTENDEDVN